MKKSPMESLGVESSGGRVPWLLRAMLAVAMLTAMCAAAGAQPVVVTNPILTLPVLQWNDTASSWKYAVPPSAKQVDALLGGLRFGMTPEEVGQHLPGRSSALHWDDLPNAKEFSRDVRYFWIPMHAADRLIGPIQSCYGDKSAVYLLFFKQALFRVSWRFLPDSACPDVSEAAEDLYAAFVPIAPSVASSTRYAAGPAQVVDVTTPSAGPLKPVRWQGPSR